MRTQHFVSKPNLLYLIIVMNLLTGIFVNETFATGPQCPSPCDSLIWNGSNWTCCCCSQSVCNSCDATTLRCDIPKIDCDFSNCQYCVEPVGCTSWCSSYTCEECIQDFPFGFCLTCGGRQNEECCDGQCYDTTTKQCCGDTANGYLCGIDQCCDTEGEGVLGLTGVVCKSPICDNCHNINETLFECGHYAGDPNGTQCSTTWCIKDVLDSATCDYKGPNWPCKKSKCNTKAVSPPQGEIIQYEISPSTCLGGSVNWVVWKELYFGCNTCDPTTWYKSCDTFGCPGPVIGTYERGIKKQCGGCP